MSLIKMGFRNCFLAGASLSAALCAVSPAGAMEGMRISGAGWATYGMVMKSSDTVGGLKPDGRALTNTGAQFAMSLAPTERLRIEAGVGAAAGHFLAAEQLREGGYAPMDVGPYVSNAHFTFSFWDDDESGLSLRGGLFPYSYSSEVQNLGLYLLRGPVYPGYLISGFETEHVLPVANTIGLHINHRSGGFSHDFLLTFDSKFFPYWDLSPAYVASYKTGAFRIGAGVNFYHLIPVDPDLTWRFKTYVDTVPPVDDTLHIPFSGTKIMATASVDLKALFGGNGEDGILGPEDLKIYGEAALIGLDNSEAFKQLYGGYGNRMPIMFGINLPTFRFLDRLSFEVQRYTAKFKDDITSYNYYNDPSPIPFGRLDTAYTADDIKWSLYGSKVVMNHVKVSVQAASDHFRPGIFKGYGDNNTPTRQAIMTKPTDWYWSAKVAYFF